MISYTSVMMAIFTTHTHPLPSHALQLLLDPFCFLAGPLLLYSIFPLFCDR